jgi:hypothetical protein
LLRDILDFSAYQRSLAHLHIIEENEKLRFRLQSTMKSFATLLAVSGLASLASAHMEMSYPPPFKSKSNPHAGQDIDYSMTAPLDQSGNNFPCKGYNSLVGTPAGASVANWTPGESYNFTITGGAAHNGGSCQASLSFDGGSTWTVIHSYIGNCPVQGESSFDFAIPTDTPAGEALFAWTWFNNVGNREMYMNCASVTIGGGNAKRAPSDPMSGRPAMFVANVGNGCTTVETKDVEFPQPGPDVTRDGSNSGAPEGSCGGSGGGSNPDVPSPPESSSAPVSPVPEQPTIAPSPTTTPGGIFITAPAPETPTPSTLLTTTRSAQQPAPSDGNSGGNGAISQGTACDTEGTWNCVGGTQYQRCASGIWSALQPVYQGTTCTPGQSETFQVSRVKRS